MKVAFVSQPFEYIVPPVHGSSIGIWTYQVLQAWNQPDDEFIIYAPHIPGQAESERHEGVEYRRATKNLDEKLIKPLRLLERLLRFPWTKKPVFTWSINYLGYIVQIARDLRKQQCDIVHIHNYSQFVPIIRAFNPRIKIVLHMHCEWLSQLDKAMIGRRLCKVDLILGCSDYITEKARDRLPQFASQSQTVFNGVDATRFFDNNDARTEKADDVKKLLFVGRVSPEKGLHILIEAFALVAARFPQVQLDIVGAPGNAPFEFIVLVSDDEHVSRLDKFYEGSPLQRRSYWADLQEQLPADLADRVSFAGPVLHSEIANYYHQADILINPSVSEAFGMSLVEAMASQTPVVATRVGGMTEIVEDGETGLLVEPGDAEALAAAILRLLEDDGLRESMGKAGRQAVPALFEWKKIAADLFDQYQLLLR